MTPWIVTNLWLIPATPFAAALVILSLGRDRRAESAAMAIIGQLTAFALSIAAFIPTLQAPGWRATHNFTWFTFGDQVLSLGWLVDPLTATLLLMITLVGSCIFVFSVGYMAEDKDFTRFFAYLSFFSAAMLGVVIANSLLLLFICWELVGLASYLLIGFWIHKPSAAAAAKKAFITTRIGDIGLFLGMLWLYSSTGTLLFYDEGRGCLETNALLALGGSATFVALLIFCGAAGKSGQFPLHVWLPDAMEGPTPVSALIHAATMVAAGVFLVARVFPIFQVNAHDGISPALVVVVCLGLITALMSSLIALGQFDIKRILAYSTVSQLGLMMVSLGVGGVPAGIMHLVAHGFFKALLFLGAGSVIHGCHHEQDIRQLGGLRWLMPVTFLTYSIGMLNLSGMPFFAGGWTKEEILHGLQHWEGLPQHLPYYLTLLGVILTALYMTRQMLYVFFGNRRAAAQKAHESPAVMTLPLVVLALCSLVLAIVLTPAWPFLHGYLTGERAALDWTHLIQPALYVSLALVLGGIAIGVLIYRKAGQADPVARALPPVFRFLENKMWIDELYEHTVLAGARALARLADWMDRNVWDGVARGIGRLGGLFGSLTAGADARGINAGIDEVTSGARGFGRIISRWHSGQVQTYLGVVAVGMLALLLIYAWLA